MLKNTKKVLALFLSICVISCSFTYVASAAPSDSLNDKLSDLEKNVPVEFRLAMEQQSDALVYHQNLWDSFPKDESGLPVYPDEYAGTYLDETGNLVILLTAISDELKNKYELRCQTHEGILFRQVEYSLNELSEYVSYATDYIRNGVDVTRYGIHVSDNSFEILLSSDSPAPLRNLWNL